MEGTENMSKNTIVTLIVLSLFILVGQVSVIAQDEPVTIQWLEWWEPEYGEDVMNELTDRFFEESGIIVERTSVPWDSMFDILVTNAQAGTATYDVLGMEGCCFLTGIDKLGGLEPLGSYLEADPEFAAGLVDVAVVEYLGEPLMLNWYVFPYSYTYNVGVFEAAGLEPPTSWDEAIAVSQALNESDAIEYGLGIGLQNAPDQIINYLFGSRLAQVGGRFFADDGSVAFNSPEGVAVLEWWRDLYESGVLAPGAPGMGWQQVRESMAVENIAASWEGPFAANIARQVNPDIVLAYAPAWCDVTCGYMWAGSGQAISSNSEHKEEAWEFIKFLLSDEITLWLTEELGTPYATQASFDSLADLDDPVLSQVPAMMNADPESNLFEVVTPETNLLHEAFVTAFIEVVTEGRDAQEALDEVAALWNEELDAVR
jgi:multiple sugar transport system substrate-binding protein